MCGIVGIIDSRDAVEQQRDFIDWACESMRRRGPDSGGVWTDDSHCMLGFRRLAIRDTSHAANQPMLSECGNFTLVFNGELYNVDEIKQRLGDDVVFRTSADTEALLHALIQIGTAETLTLIDGIFAFAFFDIRNQTLHVARDRAGIKPLYVASNERYFLFSSQYDHLVNHPEFADNAWSPSSLKNYFHLGYVPEGEGLIDQTFLVPHGHWLSVAADGQWQQHEYFQYGLGKVGEKCPPNSDLESVIAESVQSQLVSDVPVGTFLSGGVDSPLVNLYAAKQRSDIDAYTIQVDDKEMDESEHAKQYSELLDVKQHIRSVKLGDLAEVISDNAKAYSEPFADFSSIPSLVLAEHIRRDKTVALSGDGGDELYWGYDRCQTAMKLMPWVHAASWKVTARIIWERLLRRRRTVPSSMRGFQNVLDYYYRRTFIAGADYWSSKLFPNVIEKRPFFYEATKRVFDPQNQSITYCMQVVRKLEFDLHLQRILIKVDRASMHHSLEVRVPLLSNAMIDQSQRYDHQGAIADGHGKLPLKQLLADATGTNLPFEKKRGFVVPLRDWLRTMLRERVESLADRLPPQAADHMDLVQVKVMTDQHLAGTHDWTWVIWALMSLTAWSETHLKQFKQAAVA